MVAAKSLTLKQSKQQNTRQTEGNMLLNAQIANHGHFLTYKIQR
jgi:hypothetical protein